MCNFLQLALQNNYNICYLKRSRFQVTLFQNLRFLLTVRALRYLADVHVLLHGPFQTEEFQFIYFPK